MEWKKGNYKDKDLITHIILGKGKVYNDEVLHAKAKEKYIKPETIAIEEWKTNLEWTV